MTREQVAYYRKAAEEGTIPDDKNPIFLFGLTDTQVLLQIAERQLDTVALAKLELASRGLDKQGKWVGFEKAESIHTPFGDSRKTLWKGRKP